MIAHFSIPARDTRATAELFGKIIDGEVMPFPVVPGFMGGDRPRWLRRRR